MYRKNSRVLLFYRVVFASSSLFTNDDRERVDDPKRCTDDDDARDFRRRSSEPQCEWKMKTKDGECMLKRKRRNNRRITYIAGARRERGRKTVRNNTLRGRIARIQRRGLGYAEYQTRETHR